ncbi:MAG: HEAT repeat domain-containing protein [Phycisphaerae bacterium]
MSATIIAGGCAKGPKANYGPVWMASEQDKERYIDIMLNHPDADVRRDTVAHVGKTKFAEQSDAQEAIITVARRDEHESARCKAVQALGKSCTAIAVNNVIAVLTADDQPHPTDIKPTSGKLRWEAAKTLRKYMLAGELNQDQVTAIRDAAIAHMRSDECRDVRITCTQLLGEDPHPRTVSALIGSLRQQDFAIAYEAEQSLQRLTGQTFGYNTMAWEKWLQDTKDPLAGGEYANQKSKSTWWPFASR